MSLVELSKIYKKLRLSVVDEKGKSIGVNKFAEKIHLPASRISELENGKREMSLTELKVYHSFFNVSFEYLLGETEHKTTNKDLTAVCEYTGLSETAIELIQQTPYDGILSDFLETELSENGVISLIIEYLVNVPRYGERLIMSRNGDVRVDETPELTDYNELFDIDEIRTNELYKTLMFNKILARISYVEKTSKEQVLLENEAIHKWREFRTRQYVNDELFVQSYIPTPFEETDLYKALQTEIKKEASDNAKHNPKKE